MRYAPLALLLVGCRAPATDPWPETRAACGLADGEILPWEDLNLAGVSFERHRLHVGTACIDALLADVGTDRASLEREFELPGTLEEDLEAVRTYERDPDGPTVLVLGLFWLLGGDFGDDGDIEVGDWVSGTFLDRTARFVFEPGQPASRTLYDMVASDFHRVEPREGAQIMAADADGTLALPPETVKFRYDNAALPALSAWALVHEARHREGGPAHIACTPGQIPPACDADVEGAYGAEVSAATMNLRAMPFGTVDGCAGPEDTDEIAWSLQRDALAIERFQPWDGGILAERPPLEFVLCDS